MNLGPVMVAGRRVDPDEAVLVALGYAFAARPFVWTKPQGAEGTRPRVAEVGQWAYRTYDCIPPHESRELIGVDLFVAAGLNGQLRATTMASLLAVAPEVSRALTSLPVEGEGSFWDLEPEEIVRPPRHSAAWPLRQAWSLLMGAHGIGIAVTHKTLHHKRPDMFPLLDRRTITAFTNGEAWVQIHEDLAGNPAGWQYIEDCFEEEATKRCGVRLTRLRLHDIVLWTRLTGDYLDALGAGRQLRREAAPDGMESGGPL